MGQYYGSMVSVKENFGFRCNKKNITFKNLPYQLYTLFFCSKA